MTVEAIGCLSGWLGQVIPSGVRAFIGKSFLRECVPLEFGWTAALLRHHSIPGAVNGTPSTTKLLWRTDSPLPPSVAPGAGHRPRLCHARRHTIGGPTTPAAAAR
ncbi:unnamed protein product [Vitrella brassicaformis CCMP3155]|uniref:Uncharacterized protein n=1 Tax=Vitrella brassicaformis (strain CCMP3155) TaxID=1169540 RepID=A0A0G4EMA5_VITBC|nr:unnamed protein product [Vitrella brassicaformis CCMP3155]|eukprot:CEL98083.1 unnamed protein product [Vitrella brassicaformis CCMP3155]